MLDQLIEKLRTLRQTGVIMGAAGAATVMSDTVDWLPKGPFMMILGSLASLLMFFLKRDYYRINSTIARLDAQQLNASIACAERFSEIEATAQADKAELFLAISDCVKVKEAGITATRIYDRVNKETMRITIIETKLHMHDNASASDPDEDLDKTPPMGRSNR